ncbi:type VI secretion system Vgr family protein [Cupriavidus sp. 2SB]|uniref:type VI secretion system Vgr family protein n=1 Tax=Cupriavidus sp. 2SB TaxID=2502199 RepID=UPI0010F789BA|nr:type VI secretion system Vgr family protein [Cupriavidus sp. 2SB]
MVSRDQYSFFAARRRTVSLVSRALPQLPIDDPCLTFVHLEGEEALGAEYAYDISARSPDNPLALAAASSLNLQALVGTELGVAIELDGIGTGLSGGIGAGTRHLSGVVTQARRVHSDERHITYQFRIEPWLVIAKRASHYRRFHGSTAPQIIEAVLSDYIFPVEYRLSEIYPVRDYQCQYGETDYDFVVRLMQEWGITHYWEHGLDRHRLVLVDGMGAFRRNDSAAYHTLRMYPPGVRIDEEHLNRFALTETLRSGEWVTSDYDFTRPKADLTTRDGAPRDTSRASYPRYEWPGDYLNAGDEDGGMRARMRMQAQRCLGQRANACGNLRGVTTGTTFLLAGHPMDSHNGEYLVTRSRTELRETGEESGAADSWLCHVEFEVQRTSEVFRPQRTLEKPRARGPVPATVVGPESAAEHWTDQYGRIKVQFPWDRVGTFDADSSPWMRVNYSNAGNGFGAVEVPRIGQEVMVAFYSDDPDRPVVVGRAYNALNMPPWELPNEAVLSGMRSKEVGGSRAGHLLFDDTQQRIQTQLSSDHLLSQINLGHIRRVSDQSGRQEKRGEGLEARTDGHAAVRAALGLLLTTFSRAQAEGEMMNVRDIVHQMQQALDVTTTLAESADAAQAQAGEQQDIARTLKQQIAEIEGGGELQDFSVPHVVAASPAGVVCTAGTSTHIHSADHTQLTTGKHLSVSTGKSLFASVADTVRVMVHRGGMKWFARRGKVQIQAQDDAIELIARKVIQITSTDDWVEVMARKGIRLHVQGTEICITQEGIQNITTGQWIVFAADRDWEGPKKAAGELPTLPVTGKHQEYVVLRDADTGKPLANYPYQITTPDGATLTGRSDAAGKTSVVRTDDPQPVRAEPLPNPDLLEIVEGCYWDQGTAHPLDFVKPRKTI